MKVFALSSLLASVMAVFLGNFVLYRNPRKTLNRVFFLFCLSAAYASFAEFGYRQAENFATAHFWLRAGFLWTFILPLELHFVLLFSEKTKLLENKLTYFLLYGPALAFSLLHLINLFGTEPVAVYWGWTYSQPENPVVDILLSIWSVGLVFLSLYLCLQYYLKNTEQTKKRQSWYIFLGFLISAIIGFVTELLPPYLKIRIPELTSIGVTSECIFVAYAMWKYELFALTPATAAENIIATMADTLLLVSPEGKIMVVNQAALELLGYEGSELIGQPLEIILAQGGKFKEARLEQLVTNGSITDLETTFKAKDGSKIPVSLAGSVMRDEDGAEQGEIYVGRDLSERERAEEELRKHRDHLEELVEERTAELKAINEQLQQEVAERKWAEEALKSSEERFRILFEFAPDAYYLNDFKGNFVDGNKAAEDLIGYKKEELIGKSFLKLKLLPPDQLPRAAWALARNVLGQPTGPDEFILNQKDGEQVTVEISTFVVKIKGQNLVLGIARDITERKRAEEALRKARDELELRVQERTAELAKANEALRAEIAERMRAEEQTRASLQEKEMLLKEIHHRVKNNLQVISSLLYLQSQNIEDAWAIETFRDSQNRVRSMALVHEKLYQSEDLARVDFAGYIRSLVSYLFQSYRVNSDITKLKISVCDVSIGIDTAIPCGLILNELVSNSLKHAFPDGREGEIRLELHSNGDGEFTLLVSDNGIGLPQDLDFRSTESLGLQLVNTLVKQLEGTIELDRSGGTAVKITFTASP